DFADLFYGHFMPSHLGLNQTDDGFLNLRHDDLDALAPPASSGTGYAYPLNVSYLPTVGGIDYAEAHYVCYAGWIPVTTSYGWLSGINKEQGERTVGFLL